MSEMNKLEDNGKEKIAEQARMSKSPSQKQEIPTKNIRQYKNGPPIKIDAH